MTTSSGLLDVFESIPEIGLLQIIDARSGWKNALLSGKNGNDLVDLYLCKNQNDRMILFSVSEFNESSIAISIGDMVGSNLISLGYPMIYIGEALGLKDLPIETSYPLLYRSASVILEAERVKVTDAVLVLKSTNLNAADIEIFKNFSILLGADNSINRLNECSLKSRVNFYFGLFDLSKDKFQ